MEILTKVAKFITPGLIVLVGTLYKISVISIETLFTPELLMVG